MYVLDTMQRLDEKRLDYPSIAKVSIGKTRASIDDSVFKEADKEQQDEMRKEHPQYFKEKVTYVPDKAGTIKDDLKDGKDVTGFKLRPQVEKLNLKWDV